MSAVLVFYSWPRLWSLGPGCGSPDFYHSLLALIQAFGQVTVLYPGERGSLFESQVPPGVRAERFDPWRLPLIRSPRGPRVLRGLAFALNWPLRLLNFCAFNLAACRAARRLVCGWTPDVISAHGVMGVPAAAWISGSVGAPLVVRLFGVSLGIRGFSLPVLAAQFEETLGFKVNAVRWIIASDGSGGGEAAFRLEVPEENVKMLRAAVTRGSSGRADESARREYRAKLGLTPETRLVLRVCRLWAQQRVERLIEALPVSLPGGEPVAAVVVGDGPERGYLEHLARGSGKTVVFTGALPNADLKAHYAAADLYAATADRTNLSQSVLESLCQGLPVVALDSGGTAELIRDGINGRLVPPGDSAALRRVLEELLADGAQRAMLSEGALDTAREKIPDPEQRIRAEAGLYAELTNERG